MLICEPERGRNWDIKILSRENTADVLDQGEEGNESK